MPVTKTFNLPSGPEFLSLPTDLENATTFFLSFHASVDPNTGKPWCPDVVAAIPHLEEVFSAPGSPVVAFVEVGQKPVYVPIFSYSSIPSLASQVKSRDPVC